MGIEPLAFFFYFARTRVIGRREFLSDPLGAEVRGLNADFEQLRTWASLDLHSPEPARRPESALVLPPAPRGLRWEEDITNHIG